MEQRTATRGTLGRTSRALFVPSHPIPPARVPVRLSGCQIGMYVALSGWLAGTRDGPQRRPIPLKDADQGKLSVTESTPRGGRNKASSGQATEALSYHAQYLRSAWYVSPPTGGLLSPLTGALGRHKHEQAQHISTIMNTRTSPVWGV